LLTAKFQTDIDFAQMESAIFKAVLQVESHQNELPNGPERVAARNSAAAAHEDSIELTSLSQSQTDRASPRPATDNEEMTRDLERSRPVTATASPDGINPLQGLKDLPMNKYRLMACCLMSFLGGLNDSAAGALIPYIET
jgi:hypothetical protein